MSFKRKILNIFAAIVMIFGSVPMTFLNTYAADNEQGIVPAEDNIPKSLKSVTANGDGTYDITLEIKGVSSQKNDATKANVVVVFDTSNSMTEAATTYSYSQSNSGRFRKSNGDYIQLYRNSSRYGCIRMENDNATTQVYIDNGCDTLYTGTRYTRSTVNGTRLTVAKTAVNVLANELLSQNDSSNSAFSDVVEMAFVDFATNVNSTKGPTTSLDTFKGWVTNTNVSTGNAAGTNWEAALTAAKSVSFGENDTDKTYIIFVSDGNPTFRDSKYNDNANDCRTDLRFTCPPDPWGPGGSDPNGWNLAAAKAVANSITAEGTNMELYAVGTFGEASNMRSLGGTYYDATDQDALEEAFADIVDKITMGLSVADLQITDGITSATSTEIDGTAGNFRYSVPDSWGNDWGKATFEGGEVHWNPGEQKTLSNGETASVTFTVWPSQEAMDCIAAIRNDGRDACNESDLTKFGLGENEDGSFRLITNSTATFRFRTATKVEGSDEIEYSEISVPIDFDEKRDPTNLPETTLQVTKRWLDSMGSQRTDISKVSIDLYVDRDENSDPERHYTFNYQEGTEWIGTDENGNDEYTVAPGVMRKLDGTAETEGLRSIAKSIVKVGNTEYAVLEEGHAYEFDGEVVDFSGSTNHYHITKREYHPMIVDDGEIHNVIFNNDGTAVIEEEELESLAVENALNGGILVYKVVKNNGVIDRDIEDEYQITISNIKDAEGNLLSDTAENRMQYRIMNCSLSGTDINSYLEDCTPDGAKMPFYNGTVTATIKANQGILVGDLPTGATFEVEETLPKGYDSRSIDYRLVQYDENKNRTILSDSAHTQKIFGNSSAQAIVTNNLSSGDLIISKTVDVKSGNKSKAESQEFSFVINFYEKQDDEKPVKTDAETCKAVKHGETCKIENVPKGWYYKITEAAKDGFNGGKETVKTGTIKQGDNKENFVNTYEVTPLTETIFANKGFTNNIFWLPSDNFTFQMKYNDAVKDSATVNLDAKTATFEVEISDEGEFKYTITESEDGFREGVSRVKSDTDVVWTIVAEDNGEGDLILKSKTVSKDDQTIYNEYKGTTTYGVNKELEFEKDLQGRDWNDDDEFTFTISSTDSDAPMPKNTSIKVNKDKKKADFGEIEFNESHVNNKVYHYTVTETFDTSKIESVVQSDETKDGISFTIEVKYTSDGKLSLVVSDYDNTFINKYETIDLTAKKIWADDSDRDGLRSNYDLFVAVKDGDEFVAYEAIDNSGESDEEEFTFEDLPMLRDGEEIEYKIVEAINCETSKSGEISCEEFNGDDEEGYTVSYNEDGDEITNTHTPETKTITIKKTWDVPESGLPSTQPNFILVDLTNDENNEKQAVRLEGNGYGEWTSEPIAVLVHKNHGEDIAYEVKETGIDGENNLTGDNKDTLYIYKGKLLEGKWVAESVENSFEVKNTWTPATNVYEGSSVFYIKKVDDDGDIMSGVTFTVDGKPYETDEKGMIKIEVPEDTETEADNLSYKIKETNTLEGYDLVEGTETLKVTSTSEFVEPDEEKMINKYTKTYNFAPKEIDGYVWNEDTYIVTNNRSKAQSFVIEKTFLGVSEKVLKDLIFTIAGPNDFGDEGEMTISFSKDCDISGNKATCEVDADIFTGKYTVTENNAEIENFELVVSGDNGKEKEVGSGDEVVFKIKNEYTAETTTYAVVKIWDDAHDKDGIRPSKLAVELSANGKAIDEIEMTMDDAVIIDEEEEDFATGDVWVYVWDELPLVDEDAEYISYTAEELFKSSDYELTETESDEYYTAFVNTHEPAPDDPCALGGCGGFTPDTGMFTVEKQGGATYDASANYMIGGFMVVMAGGMVVVSLIKRKSTR